MAKAIADQFVKQHAGFQSQLSQVAKSVNSKDVVPSVKEMIRPISIATAMPSGSASVIGNEND
ncbi:MAG: hypothetical protein ACRCTN_11020 [Carnobacterium maltaromaticum]